MFRYSRFIVAKEEIKAGEVLLSEQPIVIGPYWDSKICCINCYGEVQLICRWVEPLWLIQYRLTKIIIQKIVSHCKLAPLCWNCDGRHLEYECKFLNKLSVPKTFLIDNFDVVTPLRFLMLLTKIQTEKNNHNENYDSHDILNMESHCDKRRDTSIWNRHSTSVVEPLKNVIDVLSQSNSNIFDEDFIQKICGILDVNTFEVRTKNFEVWAFCLNDLAQLLKNFIWTLSTGITCTRTLCASCSASTWLHRKHVYNNGWEQGTKNNG